MENSNMNTKLPETVYTKSLIAVIPPWVRGIKYESVKMEIK